MLAMGTDGAAAWWRPRGRGIDAVPLDRVPPQPMVRARALKGPLAVVPTTIVIVALGGCGVKHPTADLANGKELFVNKCSSCHTLAHANAQGTVGPNLDDSFRQDRADGVKGTSIQGLVDYWIRYPNKQGVMPAMLVKRQDAQDDAASIAPVAAIPGQASGQ